MPHVVVPQLLHLADSAYYIARQDSNLEAVSTEPEGTTAFCGLQLPGYVASL